MEDLVFIELDKHDPDITDSTILQPALEGNPMGLISESGMPCIADPGSRIVSLAHERGIRVIPLPGPSSLFLALAASGLNGQNFKFEGYLPIKENDLNKKISHIEKTIRAENSSHIFIETPYRNTSLANKILKEFPDNLRMCVALDITGKNENIVTRTIGEWKRSGLPEMHKINCVFILGK
jgi:16S rRNA (cytidine1402-2'-O)-methyltransferase